MRIAIDVMGGDNAPHDILAGCLDALALLGPDDTLVLVGDQQIINAEISRRKLTNEKRLEIEATTQVIAMDELPVTALRANPDSSIVKMGKLGSKRAGDKRCDVVISAGNTGACVASVQMGMRRLPGVHRPGIAVVMPTFHGPVVICDVGANPEPRASHLHQYAHMAAIYAQRVVGIENPRIALMSIGGEETKGTPLVKDTQKLIKSDPKLNYIGYCEGRELFLDKADVVVCEGFTGNVVVKLTEGLSKGIFKIIGREIMAVDPNMAKQFEPVVQSIWKKYDYHEHGGAPLLGANGTCLICHGSSEARTITNAIRTAKVYIDHQVNQGIIDALAQLEALVTEESA